MWGYIITDTLFHTNYNLGFPESSSDILLNLTHWQYWWWYWFTFFLCLYLFIFSRLIRHRTLKFNPKLVTSYRAHGKWGDFIIALLPVSWCINILSNSNFILRMLEWQTESNLLTIRIRGRQWYWVYKIEIQALLELNNTAKNIGHNYWTLFHNSNNLHTDTYINILRTRWNDAFYSDYLDNALQFDGDDSLLNLWSFNNSTKKIIFAEKPKKVTPLTLVKNYTNLATTYVNDLEEFPRDSYKLNEISLSETPVSQFWPKKITPTDDTIFFFNFDYSDSTVHSNWSFLEDPVWEYALNWLYADLTLETNFSDILPNFESIATLDQNILTKRAEINFKDNLVQNDFFLNESSVSTRSNSFTKFEPLRIYWFGDTLTSEFECFNNNVITEHDLVENTYLVIKQKRLDNRESTIEKIIFNPQQPNLDFFEDDKQRKIDIALTYSWFQDFSYFEIFDNDVIVYKEEVKDEKGVVIDKITRYFELNFKDYLPTHNGEIKLPQEMLLERLAEARAWESLPENKEQYMFTEEPDFYDVTSRRLVRTNYARTTSQPSLLNRRLLRTRRLLVLPTNINITLITNSFDVVHSWYIPGLGIKMDCIPGRSTHHTLHIDNAGFYYGQCAEICGRFHHHMPIRICALPFEHFLIWWYHYGLPYFLAGENEQRDLFVKNSIRSLNW